MAPLAHKEARRLTLPEVIRARGDQLPPPPFPLHPVLKAFPVKDCFFFFVRNQMLDVSHPNVRLIVIAACRFLKTQKACNQIKMFNFPDFYLADRWGCFLLFWIREGEDLRCF